jgi:hypothetical protein
MPKKQHCGDRTPHGPHTYYEPAPPGQTKQVKCSCPGTKPKEK